MPVTNGMLFFLADGRGQYLRSFPLVSILFFNKLSDIRVLLSVGWLVQLVVLMNDVIGRFSDGPFRNLHGPKTKLRAPYSSAAAQRFHAS